MAHILFLTELLPYPLVSGAKIRAYHVLRHLATHHQVTLLSFVRADDRPGDVAHLESIVDQVLTIPLQRSWPRNIRAMLVSLATGQPAIIAREAISAMRDRVNSLLALDRVDIIHADQITMAQYGLLGKKAGVPTLLDQHNATFQIIERLARYEKNPAKWLFLQREARAFVRYEVDVCCRFDHVTFVTEEDRQALSARGRKDFLADRSTVIPICVDPGAVPPVALVPAPFRITHVGTMYWPPNVEGVLWFWETVWPLVLAQVPAARLTLIGKNPPKAIQALAGQPGVEVLGYVKDLDPYLAETAAFFVPLRAAGGMRVKILDAWCWGLPVVSTTIGAEGISVQGGDNILIADEPAGLACAVVRLLCEPDLRQRLRTAGRRWVEARYDWKRIYGAWDQVYDRIVRA